MNTMKTTAVSPSSLQATRIAEARSRFRLLAKDDRGLSTVEYIVLLGFIVVGAVGAWQTIGDNVQDAIGKAQSESETLKDVEVSR